MPAEEEGGGGWRQKRRKMRTSATGDGGCVCRMMLPRMMLLLLLLLLLFVTCAKGGKKEEEEDLVKSERAVTPLAVAADPDLADGMDDGEEEEGEMEPMEAASSELARGSKQMRYPIRHPHPHPGRLAPPPFFPEGGPDNPGFGLGRDGPPRSRGPFRPRLRAAPPPPSEEEWLGPGLGGGRKRGVPPGVPPGPQTSRRLNAAGIDLSSEVAVGVGGRRAGGGGDEERRKKGPNPVLVSPEDIVQITLKSKSTAEESGGRGRRRKKLRPAGSSHGYDFYEWESRKLGEEQLAFRPVIFAASQEEQEEGSDEEGAPWRPRAKAKATTPTPEFRRPSPGPSGRPGSGDIGGGGGKGSSNSRLHTEYFSLPAVVSPPPPRYEIVYQTSF